ncbi:GbsR/MarR family transcriptional regulator [Kutzneria sp. CA-103260]|uniref:GbsR/MarR family transcriptional regulator n=1 Tax=Kutzneria sp. CA-103260 TaxID=2802641 RepID=UPI001BA7A91C|nr:MarR family transcriptional regulator [Kutzneria sp. CA-103260]QUQ71352.1 MarR family transcriptional regulator [Kutzneria sp. CA-103260]
MSPEEAELVDRLGLLMETLGAPRTMGRIYGWLMVCDPPHQSLTELAAELNASKASISTMIRPMQEGGLVERLPSAARQHYYRLAPGGFTRLLQVQFGRMQAGVDAAEFGLSVIGEDRPEQRERLKDFGDFCRFSATEVASDFIRRWDNYRAANRGER